MGIFWSQNDYNTTPEPDSGSSDTQNPPANGPTNKPPPPPKVHVDPSKVKCVQMNPHQVRCNFQLTKQQFESKERAAKLAPDEKVPITYIGIGVAALILVVLLIAFAFIWHHMRSGHHSKSKIGGSGTKSHTKSVRSKIGSHKGSHSKKSRASKKSLHSKRSRKSKKSRKSNKKK